MDCAEFIDGFIGTTKQKVLLLIVNAGSEKSTILQAKFVEAVNKWSIGQPIPFFINLANEIDLTIEWSRQLEVLGVFDLELKMNRYV